MRKISLLLVFMLIFGAATVANASAAGVATVAAPTASVVLVDGRSVSFDAYNIADFNYF